MIKEVIYSRGIHHQKERDKAKSDEKEMKEGRKGRERWGWKAGDWL